MYFQIDFYVTLIFNINTRLNDKIGLRCPVEVTEDNITYESFNLTISGRT